jgi:hypothetical protein
MRYSPCRPSCLPLVRLLSGLLHLPLTTSHAGVDTNQTYQQLLVNIRYGVFFKLNVDPRILEPLQSSGTSCTVAGTIKSLNFPAPTLWSVGTDPPVSSPSCN